MPGPVGEYVREDVARVADEKAASAARARAELEAKREFASGWKSRFMARMQREGLAGQPPAKSREDVALSRDPEEKRNLREAAAKRPEPSSAVSKEALDRVRTSVARADVEIGKALEFAEQPHTQAEHLGAVIGELDWRSEKRRLLDELARKLTPAAAKADIGGFGY